MSKKGRTLPSGLSEQQEMFCQEYVRDLNGTQAAIRAGYAADSASVSSSRLIASAKIRARIEQLQKPRMKRYEATAERIIAELTAIAFSDASEYATWNESGVRKKDSSELTKRQTRAIAEITEVMTQSGGTTKLKLHDKLKALELLGKYQKMFTDRVEHSGKVTLDQLIASSMNEEESE